MKIAILSTYDHFGAGTAAYRLFKGLENLGQDVKIIVGKRMYSDSIEVKYSGKKMFYLYELSEKVGQVTLASFSAMHFGLSEEILQKITDDSDIVNIHWTSNFVSIDNINSLVNKGKRVIITLHDENLYTGGCHYRNGCIQYLSGCRNCPLIQDSRETAACIFESKLNRLPKEAVIVTPSKWLAELASHSIILKEFMIEVIPNGIDKTVFNPVSRQIARDALKLNNLDFVVLFGAQNLNDERKGSKYLLDMKRKLQEDNSVSCVKYFCFGSVLSEFSDGGITQLGYISDETEIAEYYAAADTVIIPSLEDNLPNIMLESLMCGTPVIGFDVGGMCEGVVDGRNGFLVTPKDTGGLVNAVKSIIVSNGSMREYARLDAIARFDLSVMAQKYAELFKTVPKPSGIGYYVDTIWQSAIDNEQEARIKQEQECRQLWSWLEQERRYNRMFDELFKLAIREYTIRRPIAVYGYGTIGRHIVSVIGQIVDYIIDEKQIDDVRHFMPSRLDKLRDSNAFIVVTPLNCDDIVEHLRQIGFNEEVDYIIFNKLEK